MSPARRRRLPGGYTRPEASTGRWRGTRATPRLTRHAAERMEEMGVSIAAVAAVLSHPEVEFGRDGKMTAQAGELAVAYVDDPETGIFVVTVLPRTQDRYVRAR